MGIWARGSSTRWWATSMCTRGIGWLHRREGRRGWKGETSPRNDDNGNFTAKTQRSQRNQISKTAKNCKSSGVRPHAATNVYLADYAQLLTHFFKGGEGAFEVVLRVRRGAHHADAGFALGDGREADGHREHTFLEEASAELLG